MEEVGPLATGSSPGCVTASRASASRSCEQVPMSLWAPGAGRDHFHPRGSGLPVLDKEASWAMLKAVCSKPRRLVSTPQALTPHMVRVTGHVLDTRGTQLVNLHSPPRNGAWQSLLSNSRIPAGLCVCLC